MGDFNEIVNLSEIKGSTYRARGQMEDFQKVLEDCQLCDLGFIRPKYTWNNGREGDAFTKERLDRAIANSEWRSMYEDVEVIVIASRSSDHHPLQQKLNDNRGFVRRRKQPFRMEASWSRQNDYVEAIQNSWTARGQGGNPWAKIKGKMKRCQKSIQVWVKKAVHATKELIQSKTRVPENIQGVGDGPDREEEAALKNEIHDLLEQEESKWKQRAMEDWLRHGDRNTKYFHACATQRRRRSVVLNTI